MNFQLILANLSYAVITWFVMIFMSFIMYGSYMFTAKGLLLLLNSFIFTFAALSISFLIGNSINSKGAMAAAANVVSLGSCFISGVFVPQAFLGKSVLRIASFTPNYWYVKTNNSIVNLVNFNMENLAPLFLNMLIVMGFAVAVLSVTLVVIKQKRISN
jgi:ABC-2 type transport system permease protein